ncbi:VOC family protein [Pantoea sp. 18069]|uniref:VOC family protein n=1 Tax=Pantoea sp. 18069 TaxID=2681415 RepID=UPI00135A1CB6|nr:VOC family protein [Pantoea sp. 18069]
MTLNQEEHGPLLAVHSVDEFVFSVPDLGQARHFYTSFGLDVRDEAGALALHTFGHAHRWARIVQADTKRLLWLSLGIYAEDLPRFERRLTQQGIQRIAAPSGAGTEGLWIQDPDGLAVQLRIAEKSSPSQPSAREIPPECANAGRSPSRSRAQATRPLYLSHILLFSADVDSARRFYEDALGLRLSDRSGSAIAFMHSPHGSDHHLIALAKSDGPGLHHSSWCVPSLDAVGIGAQQMVQAGYPQGWGLGRHVLGSNYFRYVRDPWGSYAEYSYDIDFVSPASEWPAADHPGEDSLYVWGPELPQDFVFNYELCESLTRTGTRNTP